MGLAQNQSERVIMKHVAAKDLVIYNTGNKPTFVGNNTKSDLDITLSD